MFYLFLAIIFSAIIPILMQYANQNKVKDEVVLTFNYLIAFLFSLFLSLFSVDRYHYFLDNSKELLYLILIGIVAGGCYYAAFYFYQKAVRENGVALAIAIGKMGIIIPMLLSLILWKNIPSSIQFLGILLSLTAIAIININLKEIKGHKIRKSLLYFFVIGGLGDFFNKLFEVVVGSFAADLFLLVVFTSALLFSLKNTLKVKRLNKKSILFGMAVGIPNMLTALFFIKSLASINATVAFPLYSGGAIMLSMLWSLLFFREKLKSKEIIGIVMILVSLILVNF